MISSKVPPIARFLDIPRGITPFHFDDCIDKFSEWALWDRTYAEHVEKKGGGISDYGWSGFLVGTLRTGGPKTVDTPASVITLRSTADIAGEIPLRFPSRYTPSEILNGVQPDLFCWFQISILAPLSIRNCATDGTAL